MEQVLFHMSISKIFYADLSRKWVICSHKFSYAHAHTYKNLLHMKIARTGLEFMVVSQFGQL